MTASRRRALTLVEVVVASAVFAMVIGFSVGAFRAFQGKASENLSKRLILQMEARKALVHLYRRLQEGIEIVSPPAGTTLPYLVYRDLLNNIRMVYLEKDEFLSKQEKKDIYRAMGVMRDPTGKIVEKPQVLMKHVVQMNFTTYHEGAVLLSVRLQGGTGDFSLINFVRLQNISSQESLD